MQTPNKMQVITNFLDTTQRTSQTNHENAIILIRYINNKITSGIFLQI